MPKRYAKGSFERAIKRENDREYKWRHSEQGRFESSFASLDALCDSFNDPSDIDTFSDHGLGAYAIANHEIFKTSLQDAKRRIHTARVRVIRYDKSLLPVLNLVLKNGPDWEKSVCELMQEAMKRRPKATTERPRKRSHKNRSKARSGKSRRGVIGHT